MTSDPNISRHSGLILIIATVTIAIVTYGCFPASAARTQVGNSAADKISKEELELIELRSENGVLGRQNQQLQAELKRQKKQYDEQIGKLRDESIQYRRLLDSLEKSYRALLEGRNDGGSAPTFLKEQIAKEPDEELELDVIITPENSSAVSVYGGSAAESQSAPTVKATPENQRPAFTDETVNPPKNPINVKSLPAAKKEYDAAYSLYLNKKFNDASQAFLVFIRKFPNSDYADNALFWLAMTYWSQQDSSNAEKYFREVLTKYPHGTSSEGYKTADALFMLGKIYQGKDEAKSTFYFEQTTARYPESVPARMIAGSATGISDDK